MKAITKQRRKLVALGAIVGTLIVVGVTAVAGGGLFYAFQSQTDPFTTSSSVEVRNLNAVRDGDELRVTASLKNSGQTSITSVFIDDISVSDLKISQDEYGLLTLDGQFAPKTHCLSGCDVVLTAVNSRGLSLSADGVTTGTAINVTESTLEGGRTNALALELDCNVSSCGADISQDVNISDKLNLILRFTSGDDVILTDVFTTRIKPG